MRRRRRATSFVAPVQQALNAAPTRVTLIGENRDLRELVLRNRHGGAMTGSAR
jgi:hypothetical protein